ncbi:MAG TPA: HAD-IA family hydrolase [Gaiellaceae bacterium]|nr:HAD-IA family hydrolase [Gaiellaceae bacterium]
MRGLDPAEPPGIRAVIFDLWETLIDWDESAARRMAERIDELAGPGFRERWYAAPNRYTAPVRDVLTEVGVPAAVLEDVCEIRLEYVRGCLVPRPGAVQTLGALRERGLLTGLITVCSEDVETLWPNTEFAGLFDAEVFSSRLGISKPDPRIYLHCCELLGVEPREAVFVGDGANDELAGARRVGMDAILIHRAGRDPLWAEVSDWDGPRVTSIPQVLEVLEL